MPGPPKEVQKVPALGDELQERVINYYSYLWKNHQGFDDFKVLRTLPAGLRTDIMMQLTRAMIEKVPFFETKNYIHRVIENAAVYEQLYPDRTPYGRARTVSDFLR